MNDNLDINKISTLTCIKKESTTTEPPQTKILDQDSEKKYLIPIKNAITNFKGPFFSPRTNIVVDHSLKSNSSLKSIK